MIIGIGNNIKNNEKKKLKNYFKRNGYFVFDCDDYLNKLKVLSNYEKKIILDKKIKELLTEKKLIIDYTNLEHYQDYLDLCDYIINITCMTSTSDIGIERCEKYIIYNSSKEKYYDLSLNLKYDNWQKAIENKLEYCFKNNTLVTVVIPIYNTEEYLSKCLKSVLNQSYKNIEVILVDDGSTDNSSIMCDDYSKYDRRIKVIHKPNAGLSAARNSGIESATGKYICFIDSDDYIEKNMIEEMLLQIENYRADVCECGFFIHNKDNTIIDYSLLIKNLKYLNNRFDLLNEYTTAGLTIAAWNKLYKTNLLKHINFTNECFKEDADLIFRLCDKKVSFTQVNKPLYHYIKRDSESLTAKKFSKRFFTLSSWAEEKSKYLLKKGKKYQDISERILFNSYVHILKYFLRDFNKNLIKKNEYHKEIVEVYNKLIKLLIFTNNPNKFRDLKNIIKLLNIYIDKKIILLNEVYKQKIHCIGVLWNSLSAKQKTEIIEKIKKEGNIDQIINVGLKEQYESFIKDIYAENHETEGVSYIKYATLKNQFENNIITIVNFETEVFFYEYTNNTKGFQFINLAQLKRNIRNEYKTKIKRYAFDNIFHLTMNQDEYDLTEKVLKKYIKDYHEVNYVSK
jgi:glycosyltransferase involved in cell wall biosynthesis